MGWSAQENLGAMSAVEESSTCIFPRFLIRSPKPAPREFVSGVRLRVWAGPNVALLTSAMWDFPKIRST